MEEKGSEIPKLGRQKKRNFLDQKGWIHKIPTMK